MMIEGEQLIVLSWRYKTGPFLKEIKKRTEIDQNLQSPRSQSRESKSLRERVTKESGRGRVQGQRDRSL